MKEQICQYCDTPVESDSEICCDERDIDRLTAEIGQLQEHLLEYAEVLDLVYNHNKEARKAVLKYFGTCHANYIQELRKNKSLQTKDTQR